MTTKVTAIYEETVRQLRKNYDDGEASSIANILFEDLLGIKRSDRLTHFNLELNLHQMSQHQEGLKRLLAAEPVQLVVGQSHFYGRSFQVNEHVLIPRPETEELVDLVIKENIYSGGKILDVGTGTGCIAISLALQLNKFKVTAWDISNEALAVAQTNARRLNGLVEFKLVNALNHHETDIFDIIVSNPPYIPLKEKKGMDRNVVLYEPGQALFVPDNQPLLFYENIAKFGITNLKHGGKLYFEIHENYGQQVKALLQKMNYREVTIFPDLMGKDRMVRGLR